MQTFLGIRGRLTGGILRPQGWGESRAGEEEIGTLEPLRDSRGSREGHLAVNCSCERLISRKEDPDALMVVAVKLQIVDWAMGPQADP